MKTNIKSTDIAVSKALPIMRMYATGWQQFTCKTSKKQHVNNTTSKLADPLPCNRVNIESSSLLLLATMS
jgi:hypothetical protein